MQSENSDKVHVYEVSSSDERDSKSAVADYVDPEHFPRFFDKSGNDCADRELAQESGIDDTPFTDFWKQLQNHTTNNRKQSYLNSAIEGSNKLTFSPKKYKKGSLCYYYAKNAEGKSVRNNMDRDVKVKSSFQLLNDVANYFLQS